MNCLNIVCTGYVSVKVVSTMGGGGGGGEWKEGWRRSPVSMEEIIGGRIRDITRET